MKRLLTTCIIALLSVGIIPGSLSLAASADTELTLKVKCPEEQTCPEAELKENSLVYPKAMKLNEEFQVDLVLKNPSNQNIISVQSWMSYDASKLEGVSIDITDSFNLPAPGEKNFEAENNRIKIGLASTSGGVNAPEVTLATLKFKVISDIKDQTSIEFFDYQVSELGHTNVNIIEDGFPVNVLSNEPPSFTISLNENPIDNSDQGGPPVIETPEENQEPENTLSNLPRPSGLKVTTGNQYAYLKWDMKHGLDIREYRIYYSTQSGNYTHVKNAGLKDSFYITNLQNNIRYYFAVVAVDNKGKETDFSDEVTVIINQPQSSSHPFSAIITPDGNTQTGPASGIIIITALLAGTIAYIYSSGKKNANI